VGALSAQATDGYTATLRLARERPELVALLRAIAALGDKGFNDALDELVRRGLLVAEWSDGRRRRVWRW